MSLNEFLGDPWARSHVAFRDSVFAIKPAPEFSTGEVLLSSLYRTAGFGGYPEKNVPQAGRELDKDLHKALTSKSLQDRERADLWRTVIERVIQSPKVGQQSSRRHLSLSPVVPDAALYAGAARLVGNPWTPGQLVARMIRLGSMDDESASRLWSEVQTALDVTDSDDVWARWLQSEFEQAKGRPQKWSPTTLPKHDGLPTGDVVAHKFPAKQFVADLRGVLAAKSAMTRRQWISLLESVLRIASVSHVLWLCEVNDRLWKVLLSRLDGAEGSFRTETINADMIVNVRPRMLAFGQPANPTMKDAASRYLSARLGMNAIFWALQDMGTRVNPIRSSADISDIANLVLAKAGELRASGFIQKYYDLLDAEVRTISCRKGTGSNLLEFCQYTLGQRQTYDANLRGYDQGYFLRKRSEAKNAAWVLAPGPAAVLAMSHCCLHEQSGPRSVQSLADHLSHYGIEFDVSGLNDSDLGHQLRMLGLVLDSPDAESGMLLIPPFTAEVM